MAFPLVLRSTHDAIVVRLEAELKITRADAERNLSSLSEATAQLRESEALRREMERQLTEMATTLLEFANGKHSEEEPPQEEETTVSIPASPLSRISRSKSRALEMRQKQAAQPPKQVQSNTHKAE